MLEILNAQTHAKPLNLNGFDHGQCSRHFNPTLIGILHNSCPLISLFQLYKTKPATLSTLRSRLMLATGIPGLAMILCIAKEHLYLTRPDPDNWCFTPNLTNTITL